MKEASVFACSMAGTYRRENQDNFYLFHGNQQHKDKISQRKKHCEVIFAVLCDGVGGLDQGEVASNLATKYMAEWLHEVAIETFGTGVREKKKIQKLWMEKVEEIHEKIYDYGERTGQKLATTMSCIFILKKRYYIAHVGDCKIYMCKRRHLECLTTEHILEKNSHILTQAIGVGQKPKVEFHNGKISKRTQILLCSDGFWRLIEEKEIQSLCKSINKDEDIYQKMLQLEQRGEKDNMSAIILKL